jgi:glycosyltransferase involved in cell wall biosynthesis
MTKMSIVIPCYNEAKNIPLILKRFDAVIKDHAIEVILVNNGSLDNSEQVLQEQLPQYPFARTVKVEKNQGYGYGILFGLRQATGDFIGWTHADMQTDPNDVIRAFELIQMAPLGGAGASPVEALAKTEGNARHKQLFFKGLRKQRPLFDVFFTVGMSIFETLYLKTKLWDINAQPTIFHRSFFEKWKKPPHDFSLDLYAFYMARKHNLSIMRFPVLFTNRIHGTSSWNTGLAAKWKFIKRTIDYSIGLKKNLYM